MTLLIFVENVEEVEGQKRALRADAEIFDLKNYNCL
jgi:hypothetical protein